jgi:hypothetical protein
VGLTWSASDLFRVIPEGLFQDERQVLQPRSAGLWAGPRVTVTVFGRPPDRAYGGHELLMVRLRA